jgi:hypothetical protein
MKVRVVKVIEIAKLIMQPQEGAETALIFGRFLKNAMLT